MTEKIMAEFPELVSLMKDDPPLARIGDRGDLKGAVAYYLTDASSYVTGTDLLVTGGAHVGRSNPSSAPKVI